MPLPAASDAPHFWMYEAGGVLRPTILRYLDGQTLTTGQIAVIRDYLRQWMACDLWVSREIELLRAMVDGLVTEQAIDDWLERALKSGIDPL